jgi:hypothetical protein
LRVFLGGWLQQLTPKPKTKQRTGTRISTFTTSPMLTMPPKNLYLPCQSHLPGGHLSTKNSSSRRPVHQRLVGLRPSRKIGTTTFSTLPTHPPALRTHHLFPPHRAPRALEHVHPKFERPSDRSPKRPRTGTSSLASPNGVICPTDAQACLSMPCLIPPGLQTTRMVRIRL